MAMNTTGSYYLKGCQTWSKSHHAHALHHVVIQTTASASLTEYHAKKYYVDFCTVSKTMQLCSFYWPTFSTLYNY